MTIPPPELSRKLLMNTVSISGMIRYLLHNKKKILLILLLTTLVPLLVSFLFFTFAAEKKVEIGDSDPLKQSLNSQYKKMLSDKKGVNDRFPQLQFEELWRRYYKFYLSPKDPLRTDKLVEFYSDIALDPNTIRSEYSKLSETEFNDYQLAQLVSVDLKPDQNVIYVRAYGPNPKSSDYLAKEFLSLLKNRHDQISIEHDLIEVTTNSLISSKEDFLDRAKTTFETIEQKENNLLFPNSLTENLKASSSLQSRYLKIALLGFISGLLISLLLLIFGSSGKTEYMTMKELKENESSLLGAYLVYPDKKSKLDDRIFAASMIKPQRALIEQSIFAILPSLRNKSQSLLFLYDKGLPIDQWESVFKEYELDISSIPIEYSKELFHVIRENPATIILLQADKYADFAKDIHPLLKPNSTICIALA